MKEITIEEKAKRYDEAIERAKKVLNCEANDREPGVRIGEYIFPELKESEDEKIRRTLIELVKCNERSGYKLLNNVPTSSMLAWLEKQGEQREQLINKACDLLVNCIEDFMSRRMEIWDEECKKQTLENIRKKLEE